MVYVAQGLWTQAQELLRGALCRYEDLGDRQGQAHACVYLRRALRKAHQAGAVERADLEAQADALLGRVQEPGLRMDDPHTQAQLLWEEASLHQERGDTERAERGFSQAQRLFSWANERQWGSFGGDAMREPARGQGDLAGARVYYGRFLERGCAGGRGAQVATALRNLGWTALDGGDLPEAMDHFKASLRVQEREHPEVGLGLALCQPEAERRRSALRALRAQGKPAWARNADARLSLKRAWLNARHEESGELAEELHHWLRFDA
jgi:tetratricopeptide (TPR) repeat protein